LSTGPTVGLGGSRREYSFARFTLDLESGFLRRDGAEVTLSPKAFEVLAYLVEHHGRLVTKTALIEAVWPDTAITDNSLAQRLLEIRRALNDESQQLIRTVPRRGYLFTAQVSSPIVELPRRQPDPPGLEPVPAPPYQPRARLANRTVVAGVALCLLAVGYAALILISPSTSSRPERSYTQLTNFADSAVVPTLSPDGKMLAFYRSDEWFQTSDQIWVKMLPDGEPVQITRDPRLKYGISFSPDGSRIAYTTGGWSTYTVPVLSSEPKLLLSNASGLSWLDKRMLLFSEIRTGAHMGVVTATETRSEYRKIYFPEDERRMAHYSYPSPDRKWLLVIEMDPVWQPCRVVPMDGSSLGHPVGPQGRCTSAAWSIDGNWVYLGVEVAGNYHLWRQRFPSGRPEQITFGPAQQEGIAMDPDGRSLITSIGIRHGTVWIHDRNGDRPVVSEGYVPSLNETGLFGSAPAFSLDAKILYYLNREAPGTLLELWRVDLESGKRERPLPGVAILEFNISDDGKEVVFSTKPDGTPTQVWLADLHHKARPRLVSSVGDTSPLFSPEGDILFRLTEGTTHYLARMNRDGSGRAKASPEAIGNIQAISPDRRWVVAFAPIPEYGRSPAVAVPVRGGDPRRICNGPVDWAPDGRFLYLGIQRASRAGHGKTVALPIAPGESLPHLPPLGIQSLSEALSFPGARVVERYGISPSSDPSVYAYVKSTVHRNLYRIPLPR